MTTEFKSPLTRANGKIFIQIGRAIDHTLRQQILTLLEDSVFGMTVTQIYVKLRLEQSVASQHLAVLRRAGIVATERQGKYIYYSISQSMEEVISKMVENYQEKG